MKNRISALLLLPALVVALGMIPSLASWQQDGIRVLIRPIPVAQNSRITDAGSGSTIVTWDDGRNGVWDIYAQLVDSSGTTQWTDDGIVVCVGAGQQSNPCIAPDGTGGAIIAWRDSRGGGFDIYAQRIDAAGAVQWAVGGMAVCTAAGDQGSCDIAPDGAGGAIIIWQDLRGADADIYAQRVDASGAVQWAADGITVCTAANDQEYPRIAVDGAGGAIMCWRDQRTYYNTYAQRVDPAGTVLWTTNGVFCGGASYLNSLQMKSDLEGGAILVWKSYSGADIYAQRLASDGSRQWGVEGLGVCTDPDWQGFPQIAADEAGGAMIVWRDNRDGNSNIYAQWVDSTGTEQWTPNGIGVCTTTSSQDYPYITMDGTGGAIVAWLEVPSSYSTMVRAQKIDASGIIQWAAEGVEVCMHSDDHEVLNIISDGAGGAVIVFGDRRDTVWAQRFGPAGTVLWGVYEGLPVCVGGGGQLFPAIVSDDAGGAIIALSEQRTGFTKAFAQRVDGAGTLQWASDGVALCTVNSDQYPPEICSDGFGGAIVAWDDRRSPGRGLYAQRVDGSGAVLWAADGIAVSTISPYDQVLVPDGGGGAIIAWQDFRDDWDGDIYAQRIDASGSVQWTAEGIVVSAGEGYQGDLSIIEDGVGGAIIIWEDRRAGYYGDIYAQRVDAAGAVQWSPDGLAVCATEEDQGYPELTTDGAGGAIITWSDSRGGIFAQRIDPSGAVLWTADGIAVSSAEWGQTAPSPAPDGIGGAIIAWLDYRSGDGHGDIYAQRIDASGTVQWIENGLPVRITETRVSVNASYAISDSEGGAIIGWQEYLIKDSKEDRDIYAQRINEMGAILWPQETVPVCTVEGFQLAQRLCSDGSGGAIFAWDDDRNDMRRIYADRVDSIGNQTLPPTCYELPVPEVFQPDYSLWSWAACSRAVLLYNGTDVDICDIADFARENNGWGSGGCCPFDPDSLCNQSNELFGTAGSVEAILADWGVSSSGVSSPLSFKDLRNHVLAGSPVLFEWNDGNDANGEAHILLVHGVCEQNFYIMDPSHDNDSGIVCGWMHYDVLADGLGHEPWSASLVVAPAPTDTEPAVPQATSLAQNYPNPFNPATVIPFMLHARANVSLTVYDVSGRPVRTVFTGDLDAGPHEKTWDGTDGDGNIVVSGIYFYRLIAGESVQTRKMVLLR